jgi:hypothetical protein
MVFENRAPRRVFGFKRQGVTRGWSKLCMEELYNGKYSSRVIKMMTSRKMRLEVTVARGGRREKFVKNYVQKSRREAAIWPDDI